MAGFVPLPGRTARKQWILRDGSQGSLQLWSQLAEDGCSASQVILAKQLLEEGCELDADKEENAKLGVYWLTKASEQGNLEATDLLKKCLASGRGITEHNYYDVKSCLDMSQDEKLARRAAREIFTSLSNGEDFVTTEQLGRRMKMIRRQRGEGSGSRNQPGGSKSESDNREKPARRKRKQWLDLENRENESERSNRNNGLPREEREEGDGVERIGSRGIIEYPEISENRGEKLSEAALVSAATNYARGLLPIVSHAICDSLEEPRVRLEAVPLLQRSFVHPFESFKRLYLWLIDHLGRGTFPVRKMIIGTNIPTLVLLLIYSILGTESLLLFLPMALYYLSFLVMVIASFQMLQSKRELDQFRAWSALFLTYSGGNLNAHEAEYQFCRNNLKPYGHFFLALLANLMIYPLIAHQWTPQSELAIVALAFTFATLAHFSCQDSSNSPDFLALFSFGVHVLAKYPYETDMVVAQTWRFIDIRVPTFASYVVGNGIEFCLNFRAVFYLLIPAVFGKMAARDNWRGTYKTLIPHCVTLSWWQIAILSSQGATWYGLIRGALALVGMVLFLPIASLASIILPIIAAAKYLSESEMILRILITSLLAAIPFLSSWYFRKVRTCTFNWIITFIQLGLGLVAIVFLSWPIIHNENKQEDDQSYGVAPSLSWEQYQNHCHQSAWEETSSKIQIQVRCAEFEGATVSWEGYVTNLRLKSVDNKLATIFNKLPKFASESLSCLWGEQYEDDCRMLDETAKKACQALPKHERPKQEKCHIFGWNRYEFEIFIKMKNHIWGSNAEIVLIAEHSFTNFSLNVYPGDKIRFSGSLTNRGLQGESLLGGARPHVELENVACIACHATDLQPAKRHTYQFNITSITHALYLGIKFVLNFLFNPLVIFK